MMFKRALCRTLGAIVRRHGITVETGFGVIKNEKLTKNTKLLNGHRVRMRDDRSDVPVGTVKQMRKVSSWKTKKDETRRGCKKNIYNLVRWQ